jgi:hypothetical protein
MTEDEKRKKEKGESTPAKRRRDGESSGKGYKGRLPPSSGNRPRSYPYHMPQQPQLYAPFPQISAQGGSASFTQAAYPYPYYGFMQAFQPPPPPPPASGFPSSSTHTPRPFQGDVQHLQRVWPQSSGLPQKVMQKLFFFAKGDDLFRIVIFSFSFFPQK